jgi:hypothetical protein
MVGDGEAVKDIVDGVRSAPGATFGVRAERVGFADGKAVINDRTRPGASYDRLGSYEGDGDVVDVYGAYDKGRLFGYLEVHRETASDRVISVSRIEPNSYELAPTATLSSLVAGKK